METSKKWDADLSVGKQLHPFLQRRETTENPLETQPKQQEQVKMVLPTWDPPFPSLVLGNSHVNPGKSEGTPSQHFLRSNEKSKGIVDMNWQGNFPVSLEPQATMKETPEVLSYLQGEDALSYLNTCHPAASKSYPKVSIHANAKNGRWSINSHVCI